MQSGAIEEALMSQNFSRNINGKDHNVDVEPEMLLLKACRRDR